MDDHDDLLALLPATTHGVLTTLERDGLGGQGEDPHGGVVDGLVALCRDPAGEHPDREGSRRSTVDERRALLRPALTRTHVQPARQG